MSLQRSDHYDQNEQGDEDAQGSMTRSNNEALEHSQVEPTRRSPDQRYNSQPNSSPLPSYWNDDFANASSSPPASWRNLSVIFESSESFNTANLEGTCSKREHRSGESGVASTTKLDESMLLKVPKSKRRYSLPSIASLSLSPRRIKSKELLAPPTNVSQKIAYFERSLAKKSPSMEPDHSVLSLGSLNLESRRRSLPEVLDPYSFPPTKFPEPTFLNQSKKQENLQTGLLWYLYVNDASGPKWVRCRGSLQQESLLLSWTEPGHGRYSARLNLLECTAVQSTPTLSHASMAQDIGTAAWRRSVPSIETNTKDIFPIQLIYRDGIERIAASTLRDRLNWVGSLWNVLNASQSEDSIPSVPSGDSILRRIGSDSTQLVEPIRSNEKDFTSSSLAVPRQLNGHSRTRSTGDLPTRRGEKPSLSPKPPVRRNLSLSDMSQSSLNELSPDRLEPAPSSTVSTPSGRHRTVSLKSITSLITGLTSRVDASISTESPDSATTSGSNHARGGSTSGVTQDSRHPSLAQKIKPRLLKLAQLRSHIHNNRSFSDSSIPTLTTTKRYSASLSSSTTPTAQIQSGSVPEAGSSSFHTAPEWGKSSGATPKSAYFSFIESTEKAAKTSLDSPFVAASQFTSSDAWLSHLSSMGMSERKVFTSSQQGVADKSNELSPSISEHIDILGTVVHDPIIEAGGILSSPSLLSTSLYNGGRSTPLGGPGDSYMVDEPAKSIPASNTTPNSTRPLSAKFVLQHQGDPVPLRGNASSSLRGSLGDRQPIDDRSVYKYAAVDMEQNPEPAGSTNYSQTLDIVSQGLDRAESSFRSVLDDGTEYEIALVSSRSVGTFPLPTDDPSSKALLKPPSGERGRRFKVVPKRVKESTSKNSSPMSKSTISFPRMVDAPSPTVEVSLTPVVASTPPSRLGITAITDEGSTPPAGALDTDCERRIKALLEWIQNTQAAQAQASFDVHNQLTRIEQQLLELAILVRCRFPPLTPSTDADPHGVSHSRSRVGERPAPTRFIHELTPPIELIADSLTPTSFALPPSLLAPTSSAQITHNAPKSLSNPFDHSIHSTAHSSVETETIGSLRLSLFPDPPDQTPRAIPSVSVTSEAVSSSDYEISGLLRRLSNVVDEATRRQKEINAALESLKSRHIIQPIPSQATNIVADINSQEQHEALLDMLRSIGELADRVKDIYDRTTREREQKVLEEDIEFSRTPSPEEVVHGRSVSFGATGIAFAQQCVAPRAHLSTQPESSSPLLEQAPLSDFIPFHRRLWSLDGRTVSAPSVHLTAQVNQGQKAHTQGRSVEQLPDDMEERGTPRSLPREPVLRTVESLGQLVIPNRERATGRAWYRPRAPSSQRRWQNQLDPLHEERSNTDAMEARRSTREVEEIVLLLEGAQIQQETTAAQQQEIVRYLSDLNEWLARDAAGREQGHYNLSQSLNRIYEAVISQQTYPISTVQQPSMSPAFRPQSVPNIQIIDEDDTSTIVPPTPSLMRGTFGAPATLILPSHPLAEPEGYRMHNETTLAHTPRPRTVRLSDTADEITNQGDGHQTEHFVTLDLPPFNYELNRNDLEPVSKSRSPDIPPHGETPVMNTSNYEKLQPPRRSNQLESPLSLPSDGVASPSNAPSANDTQPIRARERGRVLTKGPQSTKPPWGQLGNDHSASNSDRISPLVQSGSSNARISRIPRPWLRLGKQVRTESPEEFNGEEIRTLSNDPLPTRSLYTAHPNLSRPPEVIRVFDRARPTDFPFASSPRAGLYAVKRKPVSYSYEDPSRDYQDGEAPYTVLTGQSSRPPSMAYTRSRSSSPQRVTVSPMYSGSHLYDTLEPLADRTQHPSASKRHEGPTFLPSYASTTRRRANSTPEMRSSSTPSHPRTSPVYLHQNAPILTSSESWHPNLRPDLPVPLADFGRGEKGPVQREPNIIGVSSQNNLKHKQPSRLVTTIIQPEHVEPIQESVQSGRKIYGETALNVVGVSESRMAAHHLRSPPQPRAPYARLQPQTTAIRNAVENTAPEAIIYLQLSENRLQSTAAVVARSQSVTEEEGELASNHQETSRFVSSHRASFVSGLHVSNPAATVTRGVASREAVFVATPSVICGHRPSINDTHPHEVKNTEQGHDPHAVGTAGEHRLPHGDTNLFNSSGVPDAQSFVKPDKSRAFANYHGPVVVGLPGSQLGLSRSVQTVNIGAEVEDNAPHLITNGPIVERPTEFRAPGVTGDQHASRSRLLDHFTDNKELQKLIQLIQDDKEDRQRVIVECEAHHAELERERAKALLLEAEITATRRTIDKMRQEREANELAHQISFNSISASQNLTRARIEDLGVHINNCRDAHQAREEKQSEEERKETLYQSSSRQTDANIINMMQRLAVGHDDAQKRQAARLAALGAQEDIHRNIQVLREQNELQKRMIQDLMRDTTTQNAAQTSRLLTEFERASSKRVEININDYLQEFSGALNHEVRILLGEVGNLREHRRNLQHEIGCLLCFRSKMESGGEFDPAWDPLAPLTCNHLQSGTPTRPRGSMEPPPFVRAQHLSIPGGASRASAETVAVPPSFAISRPERGPRVAPGGAETAGLNHPGGHGVSLASGSQMMTPSLKPNERKRNRKRK